MALPPLTLPVESLSAGTIVRYKLNIASAPGAKKSGRCCACSATLNRRTHAGPASLVKLDNSKRKACRYPTGSKLLFRWIRNASAFPAGSAGSVVQHEISVVQIICDSRQTSVLIAEMIGNRQSIGTVVGVACHGAVRIVGQASCSTGHRSDRGIDLPLSIVMDRMMPWTKGPRS